MGGALMKAGQKELAGLSFRIEPVSSGFRRVAFKPENFAYFIITL
jgi:hypothetical protein